jgi:hypothetical protein
LVSLSLGLFEPLFICALVPYSVWVSFLGFFVPWCHCSLVSLCLGALRVSVPWFLSATLVPYYGCLAALVPWFLITAALPFLGIDFSFLQKDSK